MSYESSSRRASVPVQRREMLEVVDHEEHALSSTARPRRSSVSDRSADSRTPTARASADGTRAASEIDASPTRKTGCAPARRAVTSSASRLFPAPPGPVSVTSRTSSPREQTFELCPLPCPADQPVVQERQGCTTQRAERSELVIETVGNELEQRRRFREVLQPVCAQRAERDIRRQCGLDDVLCLLRDDHLAAVRCSADSRRSVHVDADVPLVGDLRSAGVDADSHPEHVSRRPRLARHRSLDRSGSGECITGGGEGEEGAVAGCVDLDAAGCSGDLARDPPLLRENPCVGVAERAEQSRRALDVGEEKRHRPAREIVASAHRRESKTARVRRVTGRGDRTLSGGVRHAFRQAPGGARRRRARPSASTRSRSRRRCARSASRCSRRTSTSRSSRSFVTGVRERALGQDVLKGLDAGQQVVKIVHEELMELMGAGRREARVRPAADRRARLRPAGLGQDDDVRQARAAPAQARGQDAWPRRRRPPAPAAIDQLKQLGRQIQVPVYRRRRRDAVAVCQAGARGARGPRLRRRDRRHRRPAARRRRADGRARARFAKQVKPHDVCSCSTR